MLWLEMGWIWVLLGRSLLEWLVDIFIRLSGSFGLSTAVLGMGERS